MLLDYQSEFKAPTVLFPLLILSSTSFISLVSLVSRYRWSSHVKVIFQSNVICSSSQIHTICFVGIYFHSPPFVFFNSFSRHIFLNFSVLTTKTCSSAKCKVYKIVLLLRDSTISMHFVIAAMPYLGIFCRQQERCCSFVLVLWRVKSLPTSAFQSLFLSSNTMQMAIRLNLLRQLFFSLYLFYPHSLLSSFLLIYNFVLSKSTFRPHFSYYSIYFIYIYFLSLELQRFVRLRIVRYIRFLLKVGPFHCTFFTVLTIAYLGIFQREQEIWLVLVRK